MLLMLAFVTLWASVESIAANVLHRYSPYQVVWTRYGVHLAFMLLVWGWREPASLWRTQRPLFQFGRALLMLAMPASWVIAREQGVHSDTLMSIFWLSPLMILALAAIFLRERAGLGAWLATLAACGGMLLVLTPTQWPGPARWFWPSVMGFTFAAYVVMTRSLRRDTVRANLFYTAFGVFLPLTVAMPAVWITPGLRDLSVMIAVGLLGWLTLFALDRMAAAAPVSLSAPFAFLQLPVIAGMAWVAGRDRPGKVEFVGLLVILAAAVWVWTRQVGGSGRIGERTA